MKFLRSPRARDTITEEQLVQGFANIDRGLEITDRAVKHSRRRPLRGKCVIPGGTDPRTHTPALREKNNHQFLWDGLKFGPRSNIATDHCPFCFKDQKELGRESVTMIRAAGNYGLGGTRSRPGGALPRRPSAPDTEPLPLGHETVVGAA